MHLIACAAHARFGSREQGGGGGGLSLSKGRPALDGDGGVVERSVCVAGPLRAVAEAALIGRAERGCTDGQ